MTKNHIWKDPRLRATAVAWTGYYTARARANRAIASQGAKLMMLQRRVHAAVVLDIVVPYLMDEVPIDWGRLREAIEAENPRGQPELRGETSHDVWELLDSDLAGMLPWAALSALPASSDACVEHLQKMVEFDAAGRDRWWRSRNEGTRLERLRCRVTAAELETRRLVVLAICGIRDPDVFQPLRRARSLPTDVSRTLRDAVHILDLDGALELVREWRHAVFDVDHPFMPFPWSLGGPYSHSGGLLSAVLLCLLQSRLELGRVDRDRALEILRIDWDARYLDGWVPRVPPRPEQEDRNGAVPSELLFRWDEAVDQLERIAYHPPESRPAWRLPSRQDRSAGPIDTYVLKRRTELLERRRDVATTHGPLRYAARCDIGTYWFSPTPGDTGRARPGLIAVLSDSNSAPDPSVCPSLSEIFERWDRVRGQVVEVLPYVIRAWNGVYPESRLPLPPATEPAARDFPDGWTVRQLDVVGLRPGSSSFEVRFQPLLPRSSTSQDWRHPLSIRVVVQDDSAIRVSIEPPERPICADLPTLGDRLEPYTVPEVRRSERARAWGLRRLAELVGDAAYETRVVMERTVRMYRLDVDTCVWIDERMFDGHGRKWLWILGTPDAAGVPRDLPEPESFSLWAGGLLFPVPRYGAYADRAAYALRAHPPRVACDELERVADFVEYDCIEGVFRVRIFFPTDPLEHLSVDNGRVDGTYRYATHG